MTVHQLSVFIENKSGTLVKVLQLLKQENIQLIASTIADTADYGICRIRLLPRRLGRENGAERTGACTVYAVEFGMRTPFPFSRKEYR